MPDTATGAMLTPSQLAEQLGLTTGSLAQMRYLGRGPRYLKLTARAVRYRQTDVDAWVAAAERSRTDDRGSAA